MTMTPDLVGLLDEKARLRRCRIDFHVHRQRCVECRRSDSIEPNLEMTCAEGTRLAREVLASEGAIMLMDEVVQGVLRR